MGLMMYPVLVIFCFGIVYCEETDRQVTVDTVTAVTSAPNTSSNSTSRVVIQNKVQNLTVEYNSDHGQNTTYVVNQSPANQTTEKPLIISTSKEIRLIQTPPLNDSIATATTHSKNNSTLRHPNEIKHHGRSNIKKGQSNHFLPTVRPESPPKFSNLSKYASPPKSTNLTKGSVNSAKNHTTLTSNYNGHQQPPPRNSEIKHPAPRHVQNVKTPHFNNQKSQKKNVNHASEIEMEKVEVREMRYVESPKDSKKFRYYMVADENVDEKKPSTSSQMFEMTFPSKSSQRAPNSEPKQMDKYKVRSKPYYNNNQNYQNPPKPNTNSTTVPLQYLTPPPPTIYTVRPRTNVDNISITTSAPVHKKLNASNQLGAKVQTHSGQRDFSCLRCYGNNKPHKNYKYPQYPTKHDPMLDGNRAVKLLGPDGDNFLGGSKHHYVVAKPEPPRQANATSSQKEQKPVLQGQKRAETLKNQEKPKLETKRPEASTVSVKPNKSTKRPDGQKPKPQVQPQKARNPYVMDGLGSYASPNVKRPEIFSVPEKSSYSNNKPKENVTARPQNAPQKTRNPYTMDGWVGSHASSNVEFSVSRPKFKGTQSQFKLDPSSDLYHLDDELQASATSMRQHHSNVNVETKEIHIPIPEIIETRVPYPIHIKVDRLVPVHIDKPYPVHVEKKVPVPVRINVPQPYPVEKEVPYPVKIPIEVPRPVEVAKPVPYLVENPVPIQVFKQVKVPVKVPVDVPVPYKVHVQVEKRVPFFVEKKVPFEVPVPVEKPYFVEVKKPFEVPQERPQPVTVEKKIPVPVQVVEFVKVPIPVHSPHGQHSYQHRFGKMLENHNENLASEQTTSHRVEIPIEQNQPKSDVQSTDDQSPSSTNQQSTRMQVVLPHMISVEFPADFGHQPTGPASGFLPTASDAPMTQT